MPGTWAKGVPKRSYGNQRLIIFFFRGLSKVISGHNFHPFPDHFLHSMRIKIEEKTMASDKPVDKRTIELIMNLRLVDDLCFSCAFEDNLEGVEFMVRTILSRDDITIVNAKTQKKIPNILGHSVIFDLLAVESSGDIINIEMQLYTGCKEELVPRMEFYASAAYLRFLGKGETYANARRVYTIFIIDYDFGGMNRPVYIYSRKDQYGAALNGNMITLTVANSSYRDTIETEISKLYSDLHEKEISRMKCPVMRKSLENVKGGEIMEAKAYRIMDQLREEFLNEGLETGRREGLMEGRRKSSEQIAERMLKTGEFQIEQIASLTGLSVSDVNAIASRLGR